jgi:phosphate starvation-inducible PhoH-like protein
VAATSRKDNAKSKRRMSDGQIAAGLKATDAVNDNVVPIDRKPVVLSALTPGQKPYIKALTSDTGVVVAIGPAGTGKTYTAITFAIRELRAGHIKKIIITRPNVDSGDPLGHLPGDLNEKMAPWVIPIMDVFKEYYTIPQVKQMIEHEIIEIAPFAFMRGRTFKHALVIGDEMQNTTPEQMKMFLTRPGENCRVIVTGDLEQHDRGYGKSGLADFIERLAVKEARTGEVDHKVALIRFGRVDCVRSDIVSNVLSIYA